MTLDALPILAAAPLGVWGVLWDILVLLKAREVNGNEWFPLFREPSAKGLPKTSKSTDDMMAKVRTFGMHVRVPRGCRTRFLPC